MIYTEREDNIKNIFGKEITIGYFKNMVFIYKKYAETFEDSRLDHSDIKMSWFNEFKRFYTQEIKNKELLIFNGCPQFDSDSAVYKLSEFIGYFDTRGMLHINNIHSMEYSKVGRYDFDIYNIKENRIEHIINVGSLGHINATKLGFVDTETSEILTDRVYMANEAICSGEIPSENITDNWVDKLLYDFKFQGYTVLKSSSTLPVMVRNIPNLTGHLLSKKESEYFLD